MRRKASPAPTSELLTRWSNGDQAAFGELVEQIYGDVHAIAVRELRSERRLTIQPTALVHETYMRLATLGAMQWQDRAHVLAMAGRIARQALVDEARRRRARKRDGGVPITLGEDHIGDSEVAYDALDVDALLVRLQEFDAVAAEVVSLRVFGGLSVTETAVALKLSEPTIKRHWATGKAWLVRRLRRRP